MQIIGPIERRFGYCSSNCMVILLDFVMVIVMVIIMVIIKVVINRWLDDVTGFVSIVVERVEGVFLVLRPESAVNEEAAVSVSPV